MPHAAFPDPRLERVRDHLEQAIAILHKGETSQSIRDKIEEAIDLALECAYRPKVRQPTRPRLQSGANDNDAGR